MEWLIDQAWLRISDFFPPTILHPLPRYYVRAALLFMRTKSTVSTTLKLTERRSRTTKGSLNTTSISKLGCLSKKQITNFLPSLPSRCVINQWPLYNQVPPLQRYTAGNQTTRSSTSMHSLKKEALVSASPLTQPYQFSRKVPKSADRTEDTLDR